MTPKQMIEAIQAYRDCKCIQKKRRGVDEPWRELGHIPLWNFEFFDYRERPEVFSGWLNVYENSVCFHASLEGANCNADSSRLRIVKIREVEEDA